MKHYTRETLDQYRHRDMNLISRLICRIHLCICPRCRKQMLDLYHDDALLIEIKESLNMLNFEHNSMTYQKIGTTIRDFMDKGSSV